MNLPWYGWSLWTCFVRSRSGSAASDHERSRSSVAYSSSWPTATERTSLSSSERLRHPLEASVADGDDVEADRQPGEVGAGAEPRLRGAAEAPALLGRDHLERVAEPRAALLLHLDEAQRTAAPDDQVELVAAHPDVLAEDLPAAQPVPPHRTPLGGAAGARSRQLPPPARPRSRVPGS